MKIGARVIDKDGTHGTVTELRDGGWVRYKCRPYLNLPNFLTGNKNMMRVREFWALRKNLKTEEGEEMKRKSCPFCESKPYPGRAADGFYVVCSKDTCPARITKAYQTQEEADKAWDTRTNTEVAG